MSWPLVELGSVAAVSWGNTSITKESYCAPGFSAFSAAGEDGFLESYENDCDGIVLSAIGARCGRCFKASGKWTAIKNTITILERAQGVVCLQYLFHFLSRDNVWPSRGGAQPFIALGDARRVKVPLPPLPEQKRIAAILDKADAIRRKRQQAIQLADDFLRAVFLDMFGDPVSNPKGWEVKPLGSLVVNKDGKRIPIKASDRADMTGEYPYYGASGVIDYVNDFIFEGRHLLVGEDGANLLARSTPIAFIADGRYWVNNHAHVLGEKNGLSLDYLEFSINMRGLESFVSGSAQPKLNQENLNKIPIQVPPLILVDKFSAILNGCREYIGKITISESEVLFSSLSQKAFSGRLFAGKSPCV